MTIPNEIVVHLNHIGGQSEIVASTAAAAFVTILTIWGKMYGIFLTTLRSDFRGPLWLIPAFVLFCVSLIGFALIKASISGYTAEITDGVNYSHNPPSEINNATEHYNSDYRSPLMRLGKIQLIAFIIGAVWLIAWFLVNLIRIRRSRPLPEQHPK